LTYRRRFSSIINVLRIGGHAVTILALCCAIGLQWIALQSVAWTTMVFRYAKRVPLTEAIAKTFDGAHPCSLCHAVNKAKNSEKKSDLQSPKTKIDMICVACIFRPIPPFIPFDYPATVFSNSVRGNAPPVPPPRALPG
jgi:hypothetical protein